MVRENSIYDYDIEKKEYNIEALWPIIADGTIMGFSIYVQGHIKFIRNFHEYHIGDYRVYTNDEVQLNF